MTDEDEANFAKTVECHICGKTYTKKDIRVSRDHCRVTGITEDQHIKIVI